MPGFSIHCSFAPITAELRRKLDSSAGLSCFNDRTRVKSIYQSDSIYCRFAGYEHYPLLTIDLDDYLICLEGYVYNRSREALRNELPDMAEAVFDEGEDCRNRVADWLKEASGEFLVLLIRKSDSSVVLVADILGQLPVFYYRNEHGLLLGRDLKFVVTAGDCREFNRDAIAQYLRCNIITGNVTIYDGVRMLPPAGMARFSPPTNAISIEQLHRWPFSEMVDPDSAPESIATTLHDVYLQAATDRLRTPESLKPVVAISGGLDSRAALAALLKIDAGTRSYSCLNSQKSNTADYYGGQKLSEHLGADWRGLHVNEASLRNILEIVYNQCGTTSTVMAGGYGYDLVRDSFGPDSMLVTGDGGFLVRRPIPPPRPLRSPDDFLELAIEKLTVFDNADIAGLLRLDADRIDRIMVDNFETLPQENLDDKYSQFMFVDRPRWLVMPGQDRTRFHMWMIAPLWDNEFYRTVLKVPGQYKADYRLYAEFLRQIDPRSLEVEYANIGARLGSTKARLIGSIKSFVGPRLRLFRAVKRLADRNMYKPYVHP
jgi:hypothetical protein